MDRNLSEHYQIGGDLHRERRARLRGIGLGLAGVGLVFTIVGLGSFFSSFGSFEPPRYFWCAFVGLPLLGIGARLTKIAFLGAIGRYIAGEGAPVAKDTLNYMAEGTREGVSTFARSWRQESLSAWR